MKWVYYFMCVGVPTTLFGLLILPVLILTFQIKAYVKAISNVYIALAEALEEVDNSLKG